MILKILAVEDELAALKGNNNSFAIEDELAKLKKKNNNKTMLMA